MDADQDQLIDRDNSHDSQPRNQAVPYLSIIGTQYGSSSEPLFHPPSVGLLTPVRRRLYLLFAGDAAWSLYVVFPLLVVYWSGTWSLLDLYVAPTHPKQVSAQICFAIGAAILVVIYHIMPILRKHIVVDRTFRHIAVSRTIIYVSALGVLVYFRGVWNWVSPYLEDMRLEVVLSTAAGSQVVLLMLKSAVNAVGSPLVVQLDSREDFYLAQPRFRTESQSYYYYTLDVLLTVFIIQSITVILWVALWQLGDMLILPHSPLYSFLVCLGAGYGACISLFIVQHPLEALLRFLSEGDNRWRSWGRRLIEAVYNCLSTYAVVLLWRGLWGLSQAYVLVGANDVKLSWMFHALGFIIMCLLQIGRTLGSVDCAVDGDPQSRGVSQRTEYFTALYRHYINHATRRNFTINAQSAITSSSEDERYGGEHDRIPNIDDTTPLFAGWPRV